MVAHILKRCVKTIQSKMEKKCLECVSIDEFREYHEQIMRQMGKF